VYRNITEQTNNSSVHKQYQTDRQNITSVQKHYRPDKQLKCAETLQTRQTTQVCRNNTDQTNNTSVQKHYSSDKIDKSTYYDQMIWWPQHKITKDLTILKVIFDK
jgi:hypothetical protein